MQQERAKPGGTRLISLDGLRGWAAVAVVLHHVLEVAKPDLRDAGTGVGSAWWWINETPLKLLSAGPEAVVVFFVLSGLVVALPALRSRGPYSWAAFLASRVVRILLPVWGALVLASGLILALPRPLSRAVAGGWLAESNARTLDPAILLAEATLSRYSYDVVNTLWSLRWEMVFAVLLPLYVLVARRLSGWAAVVAGVVAAGLSVLGFAMSAGSLSYLPAFFLGTLVAANLDAVRASGTALLARPAGPLLAAGAVGISALLLILHWLLRPVLPADPTTELAFTGLATIGATGLVVLAALPTGFARALAAPVSRFLGRISFSLYLVHVPLLASVAFLVGQSAWPLAAVLTVPLSVLVAWGFARVVEQPAHRLARRVGHLVGGLPAPVIRPATPAREEHA